MDSGLKLWGILGNSAIVLSNNSPTLVKAAARLAKVVFHDRIQICDGVDDQVEIQAALDALTHGGEVKLAEGTYHISATINWPNLSGISLVGSGRGGGVGSGTLLRLANGANCSVISINTADHLYFSVIKNLLINGNKALQGAGNWDCIEIERDISDSVFAELYLSKAKRDGIHFESAEDTHSWNIWLDQVLSEDNDNAGFYFNSVSSDPSNLVFMSNCYTYGNLYGIYAQHLKYSYLSNNAILNNKQGNLVLSGSSYWHFSNCDFSDIIAGANNYDDVTLQDLDGVASSNNKFTGCTIGDWHAIPKARYGISLLGSTDYTQIANCNFIGPLSGAINNASSGTHNELGYTSYSDLFMDVLAASANLIVNAQNLVTGAVALTGTQPKYPRGLVFAITEGAPGDVSDYTMTVVGTNAKGETITEVFTFAVDGLAFSSDNAFDHITSVTLADVADIGAATLDVGIDGRLGLMNIIYETGDVWKIIKNGAKQVVAGAQVDVDYDTYDMAAAIGIALNDDFEIWYRSNLNIIN